MVDFASWMPTRFECNVGPIIGHVAGDSREGSFLRRPFWVDTAGWHYEADPKHAEKLLRGSGLEEATPAVTPGSKEVGRGTEFDEKLEKKTHREYRQ